MKPHGLGGGLATLALAFATAACFDAPTPEIAFQCGEGDACPDGYECRADGCCHRIGSDDSAACGLVDAGDLDAEDVDATNVDAMPDATPADAAPDAMPIPDAMDPDAMDPAITLVDFQPAAVTVSAGNTTDLTVTISDPAPAGGVMVAVMSDAPTIASVPVMITVPQGNTTETVTVTALMAGDATITATLGVDSLTSDVTVAATAASAGDLVLNEFLAITSGAGNDGELIEILNVSAVTFDLDGWNVSTEGTADTIAAATLDGGPVFVAPGEIVYGVPNPADPGDIPGTAAFVYGTAGAAFDMAEVGADLVLSDGTTDIDTIDFTAWETSAGATPGASQFAGLLDRSTQLDAGLQTAAANDDGAAWCVPAAPTPGQPNADCAAMTINEVLADAVGADTDLELVELRAVPGADLAGATIRAADADGTLAGADVTFAAGTRAPLDGLIVIGDDSDGGGSAVANADVEAPLGLQDTDGALQALDAGGGLQDALGWGTLTATVDGTDGKAIVETAATSSAEGSSMARDNAGTDTDDNSADFSLDPSPTPGAEN